MLGSNISDVVDTDMSGMVDDNIQSRNIIDFNYVINEHDDDFNY